jgi:hypothetical protein
VLCSLSRQFIENCAKFAHTVLTFWFYGVFTHRVLVFWFYRVFTHRVLVFWFYGVFTHRVLADTKCLPRSLKNCINL